MANLGSLGEEEGQTKLEEMLGSLSYETNFFRRLQILEVVFNMIDDELAEKIDLQSFKMFLGKFIDDNKFMRKAKMISIIEDNVETALEYHGRDYISAPEFQYDKSFQEKRRIIDKQINNFIGKTLKELNNVEDFFD